MKRKYRLTRTSEFERVRRTGKSYAHPLVVLVVESSPQETTRVGVTAGRSLGGAVERNRAKRRLRAAIQTYLPDIPDGWRLVLVARRPICQAEYDQIQAAVHQLLQRSNLLNSDNDQNHPE